MIINHMVIASTAPKEAEGRLFSILNNRNEVFNITAPFFAISKLHVEVAESLGVDFMIMVKTYLV